MTEQQIRKWHIRRFMQEHYSDEALAHFLAAAQDGMVCWAHTGRCLIGRCDLGQSIGYLKAKRALCAIVPELFFFSLGGGFPFTRNTGGKALEKEIRRQIPKVA